MGAPDPHDLASFEKAVNDSANKAGGLWLSFLTLSAFLIITAGSVTHRSLLLQTSLKLPILNVDLPLVGFFVIAPLFFILFHFYLFLQLNLLAAKTNSYNSNLNAQIGTAAERRLLRQRLDGFVLVQVLVGPKDRREGQVSLLQRFMVWITLAGIPLALLLYIELKFLPYHSEAVTWFHRSAILLDLALIAAFWPSIAGRRTRKRSLKHAKGPVGFGIAVVVVAVFVAVFPGEAIYSYVRSPLTGLLLEGSVNEVTGEPESPFANRLIATDQGFGDNNASASFRGRDLRGAVLNRSRLMGADFTGAILADASLVGAKLRGAKFGCPDGRRGSGCTDLRGANFANADAVHADFNHNDLHGTNLEHARLQYTDFNGAELIAANLRFTRLDGANLFGAVLRATSLTGAQGEAIKWFGALSEHASFVGAALDLTDVQGSRWVDADETSDSASAKQRELATYLEALACEKQSEMLAGEYVIRGLIGNKMLTYTASQIEPIALRILRGEPKRCEGAKGLTQTDLATLELQACDRVKKFCRTPRP